VLQFDLNIKQTYTPIQSTVPTFTKVTWIILTIRVICANIPKFWNV